MIHYFEQEAVISYSQYLNRIQSGKIYNAPCPKMAKEYYSLPDDAKLSDMIIKVREDEQRHADANLQMSI
jgi:ubiquinol oxidase